MSDVVFYLLAVVYIALTCVTVLEDYKMVLEGAMTWHEFLIIDTIGVVATLAALYILNIVLLT